MMKTNYLLLICFFIVVVTLIIALTNALNTFNYYLEAQDNLPQYFGWLLTAKILETIGFLLLSTSFFLIATNAMKGKVFLKKNEKILSHFGMTIVYIGVINSFIMGNTTTESQWTNPNLLLIIGFILLFFGVTFKIGIKIQEEQDLTI